MRVIQSLLNRLSDKSKVVFMMPPYMMHVSTDNDVV